MRPELKYSLKKLELLMNPQATQGSQDAVATEELGEQLPPEQLELRAAWNRLDDNEKLEIARRSFRASWKLDANGQAIRMEIGDDEYVPRMDMEIAQRMIRYKDRTGILPRDADPKTWKDAADYSSSRNGSAVQYLSDWASMGGVVPSGQMPSYEIENAFLQRLYNMGESKSSCSTGSCPPTAW